MNCRARKPSVSWHPGDNIPSSSFIREETSAELGNKPGEHSETSDRHALTNMVPSGTREGRGIRFWNLGGPPGGRRCAQ